MDMNLKSIVEAAIFAADDPLSINELQQLFLEHEQPDKQTLRATLNALQAEYSVRPMELVEVASGFRFQIRQAYSPWVSRLWEEKPVRYSRALLETLAIIAYQQPVTRGEIEEIRGVAVSTNIIRTLQDREWIRVIGHKEVPGRPAIYATTRQFLDYFNLRTVAELPTLAELKELDLSSKGIQLPLDETTDPDTETDAESQDETRQALA